MKWFSQFAGICLWIWVEAWISGACAAVTFEFREPELRRYEARFGWDENLPTSLNAGWIWVHGLDKPGSFEIGRRIILGLKDPADIDRVLENRPLVKGPPIYAGYWQVDALDAWTAAEHAQTLSRDPRVLACYPAKRFPWSIQDAYAPASNDPFFSRQWHLENRNTNGISQGVDINVRAAWAETRGENVWVSIVDNGVQMDHPDLASRFQGGSHYNFGELSTNAGPSSKTATAAHSTSVAGLIGATGNNQLGVSGIAPAVKLASWVIFRESILSPDSLGMMQMFQSSSNQIQIQNHSWGGGGVNLFLLPVFEDIGISNAVTFGREGRGVVIVRAASNNRSRLGDANADAYSSDPRVIAVGAVRSDGRVTRYSNPGSCLLLATPSAEWLAGQSVVDPGFPSLVTTDLTGIDGGNQFAEEPKADDYRFGSTGFGGTSGATPIASGIVALMLSVRPQLTYRDVQQALLLSCRQVDFLDPAMQTNAAGLRVSYNTGFGIPDAGLAVQRAKAWILRPSTIQVTLSVSPQAAVPDDGLRVEVSGTGIPSNLASIPVTPGLGFHVDTSTPPTPLISVGLATAPLSQALQGATALCERGVNTFAEKIQHATQAGASAVIIFNNDSFIATERMTMQGTDFARVPAVAMGYGSGTALEALIKTNSTVRTQLRLIKTSAAFEITNTLVCEHITVRVLTDHSRRGDLRITLVSPAGTRSVLQRLNSESSPGPEDWTYHSVQQFYESSAGSWAVEFSDESTGNTGNVRRVELSLSGVPILDSDRDGLADDWEVARLGILSQTASGDPDHDDVPNAVEQVLNTDPLAVDIPFRLDLVPWNSNVVRLSWPGMSSAQYRVLACTAPEGPYELIDTVAGRYPVTEWFSPITNGMVQLIKVEAK